MKSFKRWCEDNGREYTPKDYETFVSNARAYNKYREQTDLKPQKTKEAEHDTD